MKSALFITLPYLSHYLPIFNFAQQNSKQFQRVYFTGLENNRLLIEKEGFTFLKFDYLRVFEINNFSKLVTIFFLSIINKKHNTNRFKEYISIKLQLSKILKEIEPEVLFLDEYIYDYYFFIPKKYKVVILNTRPSTKKTKNIPPLNSNYIPKDNFISIMVVEFLWIKVYLKREILELIHYIGFWGHTDRCFISRIGKKIGKNYSNEVDYHHCLNKSLKYTKTINLVPAYFEFLNRTPQKKETYFTTKLNRNEYSSDKYLTLINKVKNKEDKEIIFFCLGTLSSLRFDLVYSFTLKVINTLKDSSKYELVVSSKILKNYTSPAQNIHIIDYLPQLDFLKYTNIMINHGGIGSIIECIQANVKILSYPVNLKSDQPGCAARVQALGFGLMGNLKFETEEGLLNKLEKISNMKIYNGNLINIYQA